MNSICPLNERNGSFFNARQVKYFFRRLRYDSENSCSTWIIFGLFILFELKMTLLRPYKDAYASVYSVFGANGVSNNWLGLRSLTVICSYS